MLLALLITDYLMQTLTTLNLKLNQIGDEGVCQLGNALRRNKVAYPLFSFPHGIAVSICLLQTLNFLDIRFNNLSEDGKDDLVELRQDNPNMKLIV